MASRLLAASGGDHTTLSDWTAWATNAANFGGTGTWADPTNGGDQILRVANSAFVATSSPNLDADALVTATYYKVTIRPNTEGSVTTVGAKVAVDGTLNLLTVDKTPDLEITGINHTAVIDLSSAPNIEWHFQDIEIRVGQQRSRLFNFAQAATRDVFVDRCILSNVGTGSGAVTSDGPSGSATGRVYIRSCVIQDTFHGESFGSASGLYVLGCTIMVPTGSTTFASIGGSQLPVNVHGCAFFSTTDGATDITGSSITVGSNFVSTHNVSNATGANWTADFAGTGNVANSTRANMFVTTTNQYPKTAGSLQGAVAWSSLPAGAQAGWADTDFIGATITKSGTFSAGAFYVSAGGGGTPVTVNVTGVAGTGAIGSPTVAAKASASPTGQAGTGAVGTVTAGQAATASVSGVSTSSALGTSSFVATGKANTTPTGQVGTGAIGTPTVTVGGGVTVSVTGIAGTGAVGTPTETGKANTSVTGQAGTGAIGTPTVSLTSGVSAAVTGQAGTGAVGTTTVAGKANTTLTGVEATGAIGTPVVNVGGGVSATVTGVSTSSVLGTSSFVATGKANTSVTGQAGTGAVGSVTISFATNATASVAGVAGTGAIGSPTETGKANVSLTGLAGTGAVGTATVSLPGSASATVTGVSTTAVLGTSSFVARVTATPLVSGQQATGAVGTVTVTASAVVSSVSVALAGVSGYGLVGYATVPAPVVIAGWSDIARPSSNWQSLQYPTGSWTNVTGS